MRIRRFLRSNVASFLMVDLVVGRDIREVLDLVRVRCTIEGKLSDKDARGSDKFHDPNPNPRIVDLRGSLIMIRQGQSGRMFELQKECCITFSFNFHVFVDLFDIS